MFFFQAEDGIRDLTVTGVQTCALPIFPLKTTENAALAMTPAASTFHRWRGGAGKGRGPRTAPGAGEEEIGRASWRGRGEISGGAGSLKKKKKKTAARGVGTRKKPEQCSDSWTSRLTC